MHLAYGLREALGGDGFYQGFFQINERVNPNLLSQALLLVMMYLTLPFVAEKIVLTLYFLGFAGAAAYALTGVSSSALCLLPLLIFCSTSFALAFGFYNFSFSAVIFLAWFGFWWRHRERFGAAIVLGHATFAAIAYLTHIFAFVVTLFGMAAALSGIAILHGRHHRRAGVSKLGSWWSLIFTHAGPPLLGSAPELVASAVFLFVRYGTTTASGAAGISPPSPWRVVDLLSASSLAPYGAAEQAPAILFVLVATATLGWLLVTATDRRRGLPVATSFFAFLALYLVMPFQWIVRWMPLRLQPFVFMMIVLWAAALMPVAMPRRGRHLICVAGTAVILMSVAVRFDIFTTVNSYYREYASAAPFIAKNTTLVGLRLNRLAADVDVFIQAGSRLATARHSVDLKNFQGQAPEQPIQFRPGTSAYTSLGGDAAITALPPQVDLMAYERTTGRAIDYFLIWGDRSAVEDREALRRLDSQLEKYYSVIHVSKPRGLLHLYGRNRSVSPEP
jgi:hypothetical protein